VTAFYAQLRVIGLGTEDNPVRPDIPPLFTGGWAAAYALDNASAIVLTREAIVFDDARRGSNVAVNDLSREANDRGIVYEKVRDEMALGDVKHPDREATR